MSVEVFADDNNHHRAESVSARGACGQGGTDTCSARPAFSIVALDPNYIVAACDAHVVGALRQALQMSRVRG